VECREVEVFELRDEITRKVGRVGRIIRSSGNVRGVWTDGITKDKAVTETSMHSRTK
jgi:hypothetical protein